MVPVGLHLGVEISPDAGAPQPVVFVDEVQEGSCTGSIGQPRAFAIIAEIEILKNELHGVADGRGGFSETSVGFFI